MLSIQACNHCVGSYNLAACVSFVVPDMQAMHGHACDLLFINMRACGHEFVDTPSAFPVDVQC